MTGEPSLPGWREEHWGEGAHSLLETEARPEPEVTWGKVVPATGHDEGRANTHPGLLTTVVLQVL